MIRTKCARRSSPLDSKQSTGFGTCSHNLANGDTTNKAQAVTAGVVLVLKEKAAASMVAEKKFLNKNMDHTSTDTFLYAVL